jgi:DNA modification methylase
MIDHIGQLKPDPANARRHNPRNVGMLVDALQEVGAARSIVIDENGKILAGHATTEAAAQAGITKVLEVEADGNTIIAVRRRGLTEKQKKRLALYDNRVAELAEWEPAVLAEERDILDGLFTGPELDDILRGFGDEPVEDPGAQIDRAAELQEKWQTSRGQLWQVGRHRLLCGDSTDAGDVGRLMGGALAGLLWTDPPYHVGKDFGTYTEGVVWDADFQREWLHTALTALKPDAQRYICCAQVHSKDAILTYEPKRLLVWCKPFALMRSNSWDWAYEFVAWCYDGDAPAYFDKPNGTASFDWQEIASVIHGHQGRHHLTQKPIELPRLHIEASCPPDAIVLEMFAGSGTTMVAAEQTGRTCYGCEIEPKYIAVTLERMAGMGLEPRLIDGA